MTYFFPQQPSAPIPLEGLTAEQKKLGDIYEALNNLVQRFCPVCRTLVVREDEIHFTVGRVCTKLINLAIPQNTSS